jgi:hypothetical protein
MSATTLTPPFSSRATLATRPTRMPFLRTGVPSATPRASAKLIFRGYVA